MSTGARYLKRGDTFDPEDFRMTTRLRIAYSILTQQGITAEWTHSEFMTVEFGRPKHVCDHRCMVSWPEWVTDEIFDAAFKLADLVQTKRGEFNRRQS